MNQSGPGSTRASLEVARVALGRMMGEPPPPGAPRTVPITMAARASEAWKSTEMLLRAETGRPDLAGQPLLAEARRLDKLDMDGMHALVAMREWVERTLAPGSAAQMLTLPPTDAEREVARNTLAALERGAGTTDNFSTSSSGMSSTLSQPADVGAARTSGALSDIPSPPQHPTPSPWAPQATPGSEFASPKPQTDWSAPQKSAPSIPATGSSTRSAAFSPGLDRTANDETFGRESTGDLNNSTSGGDSQKKSLSSGLIMVVVLLVLVAGGAGAFFLLKDRVGGSSSNTEQGVAAYARGSREAARIALTSAVQDNPNDVRALTYLGRISREQGDLSTARRYLENAIRVDPANALALRELAAALLADAQPELARRFYVRALEADPTDRTAQGFLGCALMRLNRTEEAMRWVERAGPGDWKLCIADILGKDARWKPIPQD